MPSFTHQLKRETANQRQRWWSHRNVLARNGRGSRLKTTTDGIRFGRTGREHSYRTLAAVEILTRCNGGR